jgi:hypothetical protein
MPRWALLLLLGIIVAGIYVYLVSHGLVAFVAFVLIVVGVIDLLVSLFGSPAPR